MTYGLSKYRQEPGLDLEENRPALEALVGYARKILPIYEPGRVGFFPPYNSHDFSFTDSEAQEAPANLKGECEEIGRELACKVGRQLGWDRRTNGDVFNALGWTFFYFQAEGFQGELNRIEELHADGFADMNGDQSFGLWVPDSSIAAFQVMAPRGRKGIAHSVGFEGFGKPAELMCFAERPENEIRSLKGNMCVELPETVVHRREPIDLTRVTTGERFAFRINWPC